MSAGLNLGASRRIPTVIAGITYAIGFTLAYLLVHEDLGGMCGPEPVCIWHSGPWKFWFVMPVLPAGIAWFVAFRLQNGPSVEREQLALFFSPPTGDPLPTLQTLGDGLIAAGYTVRVHCVDDALTTGTAATGMEPLLGCNIAMQDSTSRARRAYLRLILSPPRGNGNGLMDVVDTDSGHYAKMASATLLALAKHLPDLRFRRVDSALSPVPATSCTPTRPPWAPE
jgi:hypothetical protein